jgi:hypothetical protein
MKKARSSSTPKRRAAAPRSRRGERAVRDQIPRSEPELSDMPEDRVAHHESSPLLTGGDVDADWMGASSTGEEAVGGSVATPDQDIVDEIGEALGVPQEADAEVRTSVEILEERDAERWRIEREIARDEEDRG